jgi:hypothetical protein
MAWRCPGTVNDERAFGARPANMMNTASRGDGEVMTLAGSTLRKSITIEVLSHGSFVIGTILGDRREGSRPCRAVGSSF